MTPRTPGSLLEHGRIAKRERRPEEARGLFREALAECDASENQALAAALCEELAYVERNLDDLDSSVQHYRRASELYLGLGNSLKRAHTIRHAADILRKQNKLSESAGAYAEALEIYRSHPETPPLDLANAIRGFALLTEDQGDFELATRLWQEAGKLYELTGIDAGVQESRKRIELLTAG